MMKTKINKIIDKLIENGSDIENDRQYLIDATIDIIENNNYNSFITDLEMFINDNINSKTGIKNISVGIKIKDFELQINKGKANFDASVYDVASITKLFTLKLCYEFNKLNLLDYNTKIVEIDSSFDKLGDYKVLDIIKMHGFIETDGKLSDTNNKEELIQRLKTVTLKDYDKSLYTDIGFIILAFILEKVYSTHFNEYLSFDQLCEKYIFEPYNLNCTGFNLKDKLILGNDYGSLPSDNKAKILNGVSGAAGIFTNINDLFKLSTHLNDYSFFDKNFIDEIFNYYFLDNLNRKRSYSGIYLHTPNNKSSYAPIYYSNYTIAHQGYTGSVIAFDLKNNINHIILVDSLNSDNKKNDCFFDYFHKLQNRISLDSIVLYIIKQLKMDV